MSRKRNRDNINERFTAFTPVMFKSGNVVHGTTLYAPKRTACKKRGRMRVHIAREINCIDCLAALFYPVSVKEMKRWLDRNRYRVTRETVRAVARRKR